MDPLTPDSSPVRVHLRPYFDSGGDAEALLQAFARTPGAFAGSADTLRLYWSVARAMATDGILPYRGTEMDAFFEHMEAGAFPAVHHSDAYVAAYRPATEWSPEDYCHRDVCGRTRSRVPPSATRSPSLERTDLRTGLWACAAYDT